MASALAPASPSVASLALAVALAWRPRALAFVVGLGGLPSGAWFCWSLQAPLLGVC